MGFVTEDDNKFLRLTEEGRAKAKEVLHNRHILIQFIQSVLGIDPVQAEMDACKIEHLVSWETCHQLFAMVQYLQSNDETAQAFLEKLNQYKLHCSSRPEDCSICDETCLVEMENPNFHCEEKQTVRSVAEDSPKSSEGDKKPKK